MMEDYTGGGYCPAEYCGLEDDDYTYTSTSKSAENKPSEYVGEYGDPDKIEHNL